MSIKTTITLIIHLILFFFILFLIFGTFRYVSSFYLIDASSGDKAIGVFYFLLILAVLILLSCYILRGIIYNESVRYRRYLKKIEIGVPVVSIIINFIFTFINANQL